MNEVKQIRFKNKIFIVFFEILKKIIFFYSFKIIIINKLGVTNFILPVIHSE